MASRNTLSTHPDRVRARLDASRQEAAESILALNERLRIGTDWRLALQRAPAAVLGGAFALGFVIARLTSRKGSRE